MTSPSEYGPVARLPFQVRPKSGEGAKTFITRLAQANCLPPAYLRKYLTSPPLHRGSPTWDRIAAATGRDPGELRQILETIPCEECGAPMRPMASFGVKPLTCSRSCRQKRYRRRIPAADWKKVPCRVCGQAMKIRLGQRRHMCSSHCRRVAFQFRQRGEPLPRPSKSKGDAGPIDEEELVGLCPVCERPMNSATKRKACSRRCSARIAHWTRSPLPPTTTCRRCRKILLPRADGRPRDWCSIDCRTGELRGQQTSPFAAAIPFEGTDAEIESAAPETAGPFGTRSCRGCERRYRPLMINPWCSRRCLEQEILKRAELQECGCCGASMARRKPVTGRIWCSGPCRGRASRWNIEFRARAQLILSGDPRRSQPKQPSPPTCRGCHSSYQPLRPNPWCSDECFDAELARRSDRQECGACGTSIAHRKPVPTRKWCSGTCQQRGIRWQAELRDRATQADG